MLLKTHCLYILLIFAPPLFAQTISYTHAIEKIDQHPLLDSAKLESTSMHEEASAKASWGDPQARVQFKNYPVETLKGDQTPMSGIDFTLAQQFPLSNRFSLSGQAMEEKSNAAKDLAVWQRQLMVKELWTLLIESEWINERISIINDSINWIEKMKEVSRKQYIVGKVGQESLYELNLKSSELKMKKVRLLSDLSKLKVRFQYLLGEKVSFVDGKTIPWDRLKKIRRDGTSLSLQALGKLAESSRLEARASTLKIIPDVTVTLTYTKRENLDNMGDFVSAMVSIPLPFSDVKYAERRSAIAKSSQAEAKYANSLLEFKRETSGLKLEEEGLEEELSIIDQSAMRDALNSRNLLAKSYANGRVDIFNLLRSEMVLNETKDNRLNLIQMLKKNRVTQILLQGDL